MKKIFLPIGFVIVTFACHSQAMMDSTKSFMLITDQDFFIPSKNEDRNYTMGLSIGVTGALWDKNYLVLPWLRKTVDKAFFLRRVHEREIGDWYFTSMQLFDGAFTPRDIGLTTVVDTDRPFANIFGMLQSRTTAFNTGEEACSQSSLTTRFGVGVLGLRIAESVQTWIHTNITPERDVPKGWPNQISDGGELSLLYQVQYTHLIAEAARVRPGSKWTERYFQATWMTDGMAGWYTNAALGMGIRAGRFYTPYYRLTSSGTNNGNISQAPGKNEDEPMPFEFNVFANARVRAVAYNALLQGQFKHSVYTLDASQVNRAIVEVETGIYARYRCLGLMFQPLVLRTPETTLPQKRIHYWGTAMISIGM